MINKETIDLWKFWEENWKCAYNFFNSKGNIKTKSKLKYKWHKTFLSFFKEIEDKVNKLSGELE